MQPYARRQYWRRASYEAAVKIAALYGQFLDKAFDEQFTNPLTGCDAYLRVEGGHFKRVVQRAAGCVLRNSCIRYMAMCPSSL